MRRFLLRIILALVFILFFRIDNTSAASGTFTASGPVLITSAGQSADILMVKILAKKAQLNFLVNKTATVDNLKGVNSLIIVCGGSTKGLGAAKIDKDQEYKRVEALITAAQEKSLPIILVHVGGKSRRGALSDYFNQLVAQNANYMIVVANGNQDGFFTNIAKEKNIGLKTPEKIISIEDILKQIYQTGKN
jgi:hypothetical protein